MVLHAHLYGVVEYWNLQFLAKISPKIALYVAKGYYIIVIYIFTFEICHKKNLINTQSKSFINPKNFGQGFKNYSYKSLYVNIHFENKKEKNKLL